MAVDFGKGGGLVPAVVQDSASGEVLMLGWLNRAALEATLTSGDMTFYSRSRSRLWRKGETSGHTLRVVELLLDCDGDAVVAKVAPSGPGVCHEGYRTCFFRRLVSAERAVAAAERTYDPAAAYGGAR